MEYRYIDIYIYMSGVVSAGCFVAGSAPCTHIYIKGVGVADVAVQVVFFSGTLNALHLSKDCRFTSIIFYAGNKENCQ